MEMYFFECRGANAVALANIVEAWAGVMAAAIKRSESRGVGGAFSTVSKKVIQMAGMGHGGWTVSCKALRLDKDKVRVTFADSLGGLKAEFLDGLVLKNVEAKENFTDEQRANLVITRYLSEGKTVMIWPK